MKSILALNIYCRISGYTSEGHYPMRTKAVCSNERAAASGSNWFKITDFSTLFWVLDWTQVDGDFFFLRKLSLQNSCPIFLEHTYFSFKAVLNVIFKSV